MHCGVVDSDRRNLATGDNHTRPEGSRAPATFWPFLLNTRPPRIPRRFHSISLRKPLDAFFASLLRCWLHLCFPNLAGATVTVTLRQINPNQSRKNPSTCTLPQTKSSSRLSQLKTWKRLRDMQVWFTDIRLDSPQRLWAPRSIVRQPSSTTSFKTSSAGEHCRLRQTGMANP